MSTGYTYQVVSGQMATLEEFALHAGTAFIYGCSVLPEKIKDDESDYYKRCLGDAKKELKALRALRTEKAQRAYGQKIIDRQIESANEGLAKRRVQCDRILAMTKLVKGWKPLKNVQNVKKFMLEQLADTLRRDGNDEFYVEDLERLRTADSMKYYEYSLNNTLDNIKRLTAQIGENKTIIQSSNQWLKDLRKSLKTHGGRK